VRRRQQYIKRDGEFLVAVRLDLATDGFTYRKWGGTQTCKAGDWLVNNRGDIYTIDSETFARTYREAGAGRYVKCVAVWAEVAASDGVVQTKEGSTRYKVGDYIVYNEPKGEDAYAVARAVFERMYVRLSREGDAKRSLSPAHERSRTGG